MNKKLASEFAIGVILLVAFVIGGIFWLKDVREGKVADSLKDVTMTNDQKQLSTALEKKDSVEKVVIGENNCKPRYYNEEEGQQLSAWFVSEDESGIVVAIKKDDIEKLPVATDQVTQTEGNFQVKLVDSTDVIKARVKASVEKSPVTITIRGYAEICQQPPLVSLQSATIAFKKKS